jgi:hypothetical protein
LPCALGKGDARHSSLPCVICDARQRKVLTAVPGETASPALCRAPPTNTHGTEKRKKEKKQGRPGPASAKPLPRRRRPPVLRSPR